MSRGWQWSLAAGAAVAVVAASANLVAGATACNTDTANCAESRDELGAFYGKITDMRGRPVGGAKFHFRDDTLPLTNPGPVFESDPDGAFCVRWPVGSTRPDALPVDPDLQSSLVEPYIDGTGLTSGCQTTDERGAWHRYSDLESSWQYIVLMLIPAGALALFVAAGVVTRRSSLRALQLRRAGALALAINLVLFVVLWD